MADTYMSNFTATNGPELLVEAKAATVYAAHENSLFLGGQLVPVVSAPNGLLKVPKLTKPAAESLGDALTDDLAVANPDSSEVNIVCDLYGHRAVVRDLGAIDPMEIGRAGGQGVSAAFDAAVIAVTTSLTALAKGGANVAIADLIAAVAAIRGTGETGPLAAIVGTTAYSALMAEIGTAAFAGGDRFQSEALRSGFLGNIVGVPCFVSAYAAADSAAVFGGDAMRIAMQKNVDLEIARRAEAVGWDVVSSLHAGVGAVDTGRGRYIS